MGTMIKSKLMESFQSILPIAVIVTLLSVSITPMEPSFFLLFLVGVLCLIFGLSLFTMGAEMSMQVIGSTIGKALAKSKKIWLIALVSFCIGVFVTIAEPDLQVLAGQVQKLSPVANMNWILTLTISVGVGIFLVIGMLRILFKVNLSILLIVFYILAFILCIGFVDSDFWALAFDSGGVTTGPMTVPFIMAIGAGVSSMRSGDGEHNDAFGLVSLCSVGPILSVMILGIIFTIGGGTYTPEIVNELPETRSMILVYLHGFLEEAGGIALALSPIIAFALLFQLFTRAFSARKLLRVGIGIVYTFVGLVIFLTGANEGFVPTGQVLGESLAALDGIWKWLLIPIGMLLGYFIVNAEPAVYVLNKQVEQITAGAISASTMRLSLSIGVSAALGLSMLRILTGINILWILIPGYIIALGLTFFVPKFFVGIAFDSGGVASGAMMSAFVLPMAMGACKGLKYPDISWDMLQSNTELMTRLSSEILTQAFGCVAFVALTPIISIQVCGLIYNLKSRKAVNRFIAEQEYFIDYTQQDAEVTD